MTRRDVAIRWTADSACLSCHGSGLACAQVCICVRAEPAPKREGADTTPRCEVCDWPLAVNIASGCVPGFCSYRPDRGSDEGRRIAARRAELAMKRTGTTEAHGTGEGT
jgi:hypothetical protein